MDLIQIADQAAQKFGVPTNLFEAQIGQESSWNPDAQNGEASGIAQFIPSTAAQYGVDTTDPVSSLFGAAQYDADLFKQTGSWTGAMQAYGTIPTSGTLTSGQQNVATIAGAADSSSPLSWQNIFNWLGGGDLWMQQTQEQLVNPQGAQEAANAAQKTANAATDKVAQYVAQYLGRGTTIIIGAVLLAAGIFAIARGKQIIAIAPSV